MESRFLSYSSVTMIKTITGSGINQFNKIGEPALSDEFLFFDNSNLKGFDTFPHTASSRTVTCASFQVLMMPLCGGLGIGQYYKPLCFMRLRISCAIISN